MPAPALFTFILFLSALIPVSRAGSPPSFMLTKMEGLYTLEARGTPLADILSAINRHEQAVLRFIHAPDRKITCRFIDQRLEELLLRLRVNYILTYAHREGGYYLDDAQVMGSGTKHFTIPGFGTLDPGIEDKVLCAIEDLRDDDVAFNAIRAMQTLYEVGCDAIPYLERALNDGDYQLRHCAASVLWYGCPEYNPTDRLLEVSVEFLRGESYPYEMRDLARPSGAYHYLRTHTNAAQRVKAQLVGNLSGGDRQQQLLSALILAEHNAWEYAGRLADILIPHLEDNDLKSDAGLAAYALHQLGEAVRPRITPLLDSPDAQQADLARLIIHQLDQPWSTNAVVKDFYFNTRNPNPVIRRPYMSTASWYAGDFPGAEGGEQGH